MGVLAAYACRVEGLKALVTLLLVEDDVSVAAVIGRFIRARGFAAAADISDTDCPPGLGAEPAP